MMCLFTVAKCGNFSIFFLVNTSWRKSFRLAAVMKNEQSIILLFCCCCCIYNFYKVQMSLRWLKDQVQSLDINQQLKLFHKPRCE